MLSEGVDIKACNKVIRFDKVKNVTDNIQARGRLRQEEAKSKSESYVVMIEDTGRIVSSFTGYAQLFEQEEEIHRYMKNRAFTNTSFDPVVREDLLDIVPFSKVCSVCQMYVLLLTSRSYYQN